MFNGNMGPGMDDLVMRRRVGAPAPPPGPNMMDPRNGPANPYAMLIPLMQKLGRGFEGTDPVSPMRFGSPGAPNNNSFKRASGQKPIGGSGFNPYAAGKKQYGASPNRGPMRDKTPFQERDRNAINLRNAMLKRLKARGQGRFMTPENLRD